MPFGQQRRDPLADMRQTISDIAAGERSKALLGAQIAQRARIRSVLDTYTRKVTGDRPRTVATENPQFGGMIGLSSQMQHGATAQEEREAAGSATMELLGEGTPEARQAASDFTKIRREMQPRTPKTELEALIEENGGDLRSATAEYDRRLINRSRQRRTRAETPYEDFSSGFPDTPDGRKQAALAWIQVQTGAKTKATAPKYSIKTEAAADSRGMMYWTGIRSDGQPFKIYPKDPVTWKQWTDLHPSAKEKAMEAAAAILSKQLGQTGTETPPDTGAATYHPPSRTQTPNERFLGPEPSTEPKDTTTTTSAGTRVSDQAIPFDSIKSYIAQQESAGGQKRVGSNDDGSVDVGMYQINSRNLSRKVSGDKMADALDPIFDQYGVGRDTVDRIKALRDDDALNEAVARAIYEQRGLGQWSTKQAVLDSYFNDQNEPGSQTDSTASGTPATPARAAQAPSKTTGAQPITETQTISLKAYRSQFGLTPEEYPDDYLRKHLEKNGFKVSE